MSAKGKRSQGGTTFRPDSVRRILLPLLVAAIVASSLGVTATARAQGLYYQEVAKDGRIFVFNTGERYKAFKATGEMGTAITLAGRGPGGETVVAENETALDLFLFRHNLPAYERPATKPAPPAPPAFPQVKVGGQGFVSYQSGESGGADYSKFVIKRAYINVNAALTSFLTARITPDIAQDATTGEMKFRLKFAYGQFSLPKLGFLAKPYGTFGMLGTPWLEFEDKINRYRMQDNLFLDRIGLMTTADGGVVVGGLFGGEMPAEYQKTVSNAFAGRYGSFAVGVYNGSSFTAAEQNTNKSIEGRLSIRPLPDLVPGLQITYAGVTGKGNTAAEPDRAVSLGAVTYESRRLNVVGQYFTGRGDLAGKAIDKKGVALDRKGWSGFVEAKATPEWSVIGRYDSFKADTANPLKDTKRVIVGVAYHLGKGNDLLLDYDRLTYSDPAKKDDRRTQLTLQFNF